MAVVIYAIVLVALLVVYYFSKKGTASQVFIQCVEAGPTSEVDAEELKRRSYYDKDTVIRGMQGEVLSSARYKRILVKGTCMTPKNINDGDLLVAETFSENTDFHRELRKGDIVWLKIEDTGMDKIRIFDGWNGDEMKTYYYKGDKKHPSSLYHHPSQICGVVRYKI